MFATTKVIRFCWCSPQSQSEMDKLTCYFYNKHPFIAIKPVKIEMASLKPNIYLLHDIIRDTDIEFIKDLAAPRVSKLKNESVFIFCDYFWFCHFSQSSHTYPNYSNNNNVLLRH